MQYIKNKKYCIEERAKKHYGLTDIFEFAGYMLEDGTMLNFSTENRQRDADHRDANFLFKNASGTEVINKLMRRGNIRVICNDYGLCFEFSKKITKMQLSRLREAEKLADIYNIDFYFEKSTKKNHKTTKKIYRHVYEYAENN